MAAASLSALLKLPKRRRLEIAENLWLSVADEKSCRYLRHTSESLKPA